MSGEATAAGPATASVQVSLPANLVKSPLDLAWTIAAALATSEGLLTAGDGNWAKAEGPIVVDVGDYRFTWRTPPYGGFPPGGHPPVVSKRQSVASNDPGLRL